MKNFSVDQVRISTGFSNRLIGEYLNLYKKYSKEDNHQLKALLNIASCLPVRQAKKTTKSRK
jgi:hypothetical protein